MVSFDKHVIRCDNFINADAISQPESNNQSTKRSSSTCEYCGKTFDSINRHISRCKFKNCIPGAIFTFTDDFFNDSPISQVAENENVLDKSFNTTAPSQFQEEGLRHFMKSKLQNKLSNAQLNINSVEKKFIEIRFLLDKQLVDILEINESKIDSTIDD